MEGGSVQGLEGRDTESLRLTLRQGLKNEKHRSSDYLSLPTLSFFRALCNLPEGPPLRNLGPLNREDLGLLSSDPGFNSGCPNNVFLDRILGVRIIGSVHSVCQTNR